MPFSHSADYTPACTTELGSVARLMENFKRRDVKVLAVSVDPVTTHKEWVKDIDETQRTHVEFPILGDQDRKVSILYDMIHPRQSDTSTDKYAVATPDDWRSGDDIVISPALKDKAALKAQFPKGYKEIRPYLRMTPQPGP